MKIILVVSAAALLGIGLADDARAGVISFNFDDPSLSSSSGSSTISQYMTDIWGSSVTSSDGRIRQDSPSVDWGLDGNTTRYLSTDLQAGNGVALGDIEVSFDSAPIYGVRFDGFILDATAGADFTFEAFGAAYGLRELPSSSALVYSESWEFGVDGMPFDTGGWIYFNAPVTLLRFSDSGSYDVGFDNLQVLSRPVPLPGAVWMAGMLLAGLGVGRRVRSRKAKA